MSQEFVDLPITYNNGNPAYGFTPVYSSLNYLPERKLFDDWEFTYEDMYEEMMRTHAFWAGMSVPEYADFIRATMPRDTFFSEDNDTITTQERYNFDSRSFLIPDDFLFFLRNTTVPELNISSGFHYSPQAIRSFMQVLMNPQIYTSRNMGPLMPDYLYNEFTYLAVSYLYSCNLITGREANLIIDGNPSFLLDLLKSPDQIYTDSEDLLYDNRSKVYQDYSELAEDLKKLREVYPNAKVFLIHGKFNIVPPHLGYIGLFNYFSESLYRYQVEDKNAILIVGCDSNKTLSTFGNIPIWNTFARMSFFAQHPQVDFVFKSPDFLTKRDAYKGWANVYRDLGVNFVNIEADTPLEFKQRAQAKWAGAKRISMIKNIIYPADPFVGEDDDALTKYYLDFARVNIRSSIIKANRLKLTEIEKLAISTIHELNEKTETRKVNWNKRLNAIKR